MQQILNKMPVLALCLFFTFSAAGLFANEPVDEPVKLKEPGILFINSNPINASIMLDGEPLLQKTPALVRDIEAGEHEVIIIKEGFAPAYLPTVIESGRTGVLDCELSAGTLIAGFPDQNEIILRTDDEKILPQYVRIDSGEYSIERENGRLYIEPIYPKQTLFTVTGTLLGTALFSTLISAGIELADEKELLLPHSTHLVITESITAVAALTELALWLDRKFFIDSYKAYKTDLEKLDSEARTLFENAEISLRQRRLEDAVSGFSTIVSDYPDFEDFPEALYRLARLHIISGDVNLAAAELGILINNYPDPAFYDKGCQALALLYHNSEQIEKSIETVEMMVFYDPLFTEAESGIAASGIEKTIENWARNPEGQAE